MAVRCRLRPRVSEVASRRPCAWGGATANVLKGCPHMRPCQLPRLQQRHLPASQVHRLQAAAAALATYELLTTRSPLVKSFESCVQEIVKGIDEAPFLQLLYSQRYQSFQRIHVSEGVVTQPEVWRDYAASVSSQAPDMLFLLHQVDNVEDTCVVKKARSKQGASCSYPRADTDRVLLGHVGDCCDEEDQDDALVQQLQADMDDNAACADGLHVQYFGLVVQSRVRGEVDGCYLLKAVRHRDLHACHCTHYSLTRVCRGEGLLKQMRNTWLL